MIIMDISMEKTDDKRVWKKVGCERGGVRAFMVHGESSDQ